jgi:tripartite-type tricarboxylate transporter receptor subunit TctC
MKAPVALTVVTALAMAAASSGPVTAQPSYPAKVVHFITPFPPGGSLDPLTRMSAQKLSERWGQSTVVENRPGGNSIIGTQAVARAAPDGYTLLVAGTPHVINPSLFRAPYDAIKDFAPIATIARSRQILIVNRSMPVNSVKEVIALAKAKPGQLNYATSTTAGLVTTAMFAQKVGIKLQHIPYKGAGPALNDLLGGHVQMFFSTPSSMVGHVRNGKVRALGITSDQRLSALPNVPTFVEAGVTDFDAKSLRGVLAPKGTPKAAVTRLSAELEKVLAMPDIKERMAMHGMGAFFMTPAAFETRMREEYARYAQVIKTIEIKGER